MRIGTVPSHQLSSRKGLTASDYLPNPRRIAEELVQQWSRQFGGIVTLGSPAGKALAALVEKAIRKALTNVGAAGG